MIPESLKLFPIYLSTALKSHALRLLNKDSEGQLDHKLFWIHKYLSMPFGRVTYLLYPRIYRVTDLHGIIGYQRSYGGDPNC